MGFWSWRLLNSIETKFYPKLRRHYSKKQTKHNLRLVRALYINIAARYNLTPRQLYKCLPLKLKIDDNMVNEVSDHALAFCGYGYMIEPLWDNVKINLSRSVIVMRSDYITSSTFIHEFGHYIRFLLPMVYFIYGKVQAMNDINFISKYIMNNQYALNNNDVISEYIKNNQYALNNNNNNNNIISEYIKKEPFLFTKNTRPEDMTGNSEEMMRKPEYLRREAFTTEEEERFAKTWEKYVRNGEAPNKEFERLFADFRKDIHNDMNNQRKKYEGDYFEDLEVNITPTIKRFLDELIAKNTYKGMSFFGILFRFIFYMVVMLCVIHFVRIKIAGKWL
jgi:hypothetical protein